MRSLPNSAHAARNRRIREATGDFDLEDVWELSSGGGPADFARVVEQLRSFDPSRSPSPVARALFAIRWKLGELLGRDGPRTGVGGRVASLRDRLPAGLRDAPRGPAFEAVPVTPLCLLDDEWAPEAANRTVHGVIHAGWVPDDGGGHRVQLAVSVERDGPLGTAHMAAIRPFRHLLVHPPLLRELQRVG